MTPACETEPQSQAQLGLAQTRHLPVICSLSSLDNWASSSGPTLQNGSGAHFSAQGGLGPRRGVLALLLTITGTTPGLLCTRD